MAKKCLFSKTTENVNTSVIVNCGLGPVTVHVSDNELTRTLVEVTQAVETLVEQAQSLAETFGFDLEEAITKGGMMSLGAPTPVASTPVPVVSRPSGGVPQMTMQPIPSKTPEFQESEEEASGVASIATPSASNARPIQESVAVAPGEKLEKKSLIQTPHGRQLVLPERIIDETGETTVVIDTESEKNFNQQWERQKADKSGGPSYKDSYGVEFRPCKLCVDPKTKTPTGRVNGQPCPKCKGAAEVMVRR